MNQEQIEKIEDILRSYENDFLSDMVIEQIKVLLAEIDLQSDPLA